MPERQTYVLVGAGGTGSILMPPLLRYLTTYHRDREPFVLAIIDGDEVEEKNLDRQLFDGADILSNKAAALASKFINTRAIPEFLDDDNIEQRVLDGDVVLIAADNYNVRARIERHGKTLDNLVVINGGNESRDGSVQIWIREKGHDMSPPLSRFHPEILIASEHDPAALDCIQRAQLPGGEQTIIANLMSAAQMLNALQHYHQVADGGGELSWHEVYFDLLTGNAKSYQRNGWDAA